MNIYITGLKTHLNCNMNPRVFIDQVLDRACAVIYRRVTLPIKKSTEPLSGLGPFIQPEISRHLTRYRIRLEWSKRLWD